MPNCAVPGCTSGYASNLEKVHFFTIPKNPEQASLWKDAIRRNSTVKSGRPVCEKHFLKTEIVWQRELYDSAGRVLGISTYKVPRLKPGSVPSVFAWDELSTTSAAESIVSSDEKDPSFAASMETLEPPTECQNLEAVNEDIGVHAGETLLIPIDSDKAENRSDLGDPLRLAELCTVELQLPSGWITKRSKIEGSEIFTLLTLESAKIEARYQMCVAKSVTVTEYLAIQISIYGHSVNPTNFDLPCRIASVESLQELIHIVDRLHTCTGCNGSSQLPCRTLKKDAAGSWRHTNCIGLLSNTTVCQFCRVAKKCLANKLRRMKKNEAKDTKIKASTLKDRREQWVKLQAKCRKALRGKRQALEKNKTLKSKIHEIRLKMARLTTADLEKHIQDGNIEKNQLHVLEAIIKSAKCKNSRGQKYSEEWLLLCMLMHMRSPSGYNFLRSNEILPLPCVRTIRRHLSKIEINCGFDPQFFEVLKVALNKKDESLRHGILLLDEISTRESVSVDTKALTYRGLINFGAEGEHSTDLTKKANHGLVLMYQTLNDAYTQPIAVFASRGPVKGEILAKLIIKAIVLLEGIGVKIHGVVSDGASPNRKFLSILGIDASKNNLRNYFEHPTIEGRKVYVFSDTPDLIKTIRNRFHKAEVLQLDPTEPLIKWEYIKKLHEVDIKNAGPGQALVCPKLTKHHVYLNNALKMRVRLATQVFSNSVAGGLRFYERHEPELQGCEATAKFCKWMNDMFDALNRTRAFDGVTPGNLDFKRIEESLEKLNSWEEEMLAGRLSKDLFLTQQTADGLRVTLKSMLDLVSYLTEHCGFPYVLTGRINQDPLEKFFRTVRQAGGCDDHPSTPTFLSIYKILSTYSVLKPPKTGNCSISSDKPASPLVSLADLKEIYKNSKQSAILSENIKIKLEEIIRQEDWDFESMGIGENDYSLPEVNNCVLYCLTADLTKRICNTVKCLVCKEALIKPEATAVVLPEAVLTQWQQRDGLVHPNARLYRFVVFLESQFEKHCKSTNVFEEILQEVYNYTGLSYPCLDHAHHIILQLIQYFVTMRMQQYCTRLNSENEKIYQLKKKTSEFCKT